MQTTYYWNIPISDIRKWDRVMIGSKEFLVLDRQEDSDEVLMFRKGEEEDGEEQVISIQTLEFLADECHRFGAPLPRGIGATVRLASGETYVRVGMSPVNYPWYRSVKDEDFVHRVNDEWLSQRELEVLGEGVEL